MPNLQYQLSMHEENLQKEPAQPLGDNEVRQQQMSNPFKIRQATNPFKVGDTTNPFKVGETIDPSKAGETSNPFKMGDTSNPFKIHQGPSRKEPMFFQREESAPGELPPGKVDSRSLLSSEAQPALRKAESKMDGLHAEQNIKKYKDMLRAFYNSNYFSKIRSFDEPSKKTKKDSSSNQSLSQQFRKPQTCFKATRLVFNRENKAKANNYKKVEQTPLISYINGSKCFLIYEMKQPNLKLIKPIQIQINQSSIAESIEYDPTYSRLFFFSNATQEIVVVGAKNKEVICRVGIKHPRTNPLLYMFKQKTSLYLMVTGGYQLLGQAVLEGSKYVQIFVIDKWEISLKSVVLRLGIGRINPIIFECQQDGAPFIFILGGHSNASINRKRQMNFSSSQDINYSANQTGVRIDPSFIEECFLSGESNTLLGNNVNVRFAEPLQLYGGCVLFRRVQRHDKMELFLPGKTQIYTVKLIKDDVHIIRSDMAIQESIVGQSNGAINKCLGYHRDASNISVLYKLDGRGEIVPVSVTASEKKKKKEQNTFQCSTM